MEDSRSHENGKSYKKYEYSVPRNVQIPKRI